jgi:hypothetical protein
MTSFATVELKRCPGWRHAGYEGHAPHTLPATTEYFHRSLTKPDGLNPQCKCCTRGYQVQALARCGTRSDRSARPRTKRRWHMCFKRRYASPRQAKSSTGQGKCRAHELAKAGTRLCQPEFARHDAAHRRVRLAGPQGSKRYVGERNHDRVIGEGAKRGVLMGRPRR